MHDPILININISQIPKTHYWKMPDGSVMLTVKVCERKEPSEKGMTHYARIYDKVEKEKIFCGFGKFEPFKPTEINDSDLPPGADDIEDADVISETSDKTLF